MHLVICPLCHNPDRCNCTAKEVLDASIASFTDKEIRKMQEEGWTKRAMDIDYKPKKIYLHE